MTCWKCGQEISGGSRYCTRCGTDQQQRAAAQEPVKKKKSGVKGIVILLLAILAGRFAGYLFGSGMAGWMNSGRSSSNTGIPAVHSAANTQNAGNSMESAIRNVAQDLVVRHETVMQDLGDGFVIYYTIFFGNDTDTLMGWNVEYVGEKACGYTLDDFKAADFESGYPSFAAVSYYETDDTVSAVIEMRELKETSRIKALADYELIEGFARGEEIRPLDAGYLLDSLREYGWSSVTDYTVIVRLHVRY